MSVYDLSAGWNLDEDSPVWADWRSPYGRSKVEAERIVHAASAQGLMSVTLRPVPVLSLHPRSFWGPLALARALAMNSPVFGCTELPFVHVDNLADAVVRALHSDKAIGRHYDVIDAYGPTTRYLDALAVATGRPAPHLSDEAPTIRIAGQRIRAELGYDPEDRFEEFITQLKDAATNGRIARLPQK
jgi:nucleoside-diphosphate-sugar epimerase